MPASAPRTPPTLLCVHPHPDDESIACGGLLASSAEAGRRTVVVTCTAGEQGENLGGIDLGGEDLVAHRRRELADALDVLGVTAHHWLGYRDSGMAGSPANDRPDSFHAAPVDEAAQRLAALVRRWRPLVVVSDDRDGTYGHPDHVKAHRVTARAVALAAQPAADGTPGWVVPRRYVHTLSRGRLHAAHTALLAAGLVSPFGPAAVDAAQLPFGAPDDAVTARIDIAHVLDRKRAAMAAHRSQIGPDSYFLNVPDGLAGSLFGVEEFILEAVDAAPPDPGATAGIEVVDDLFAGLVPRA